MNPQGRGMQAYIGGILVGKAKGIVLDNSPSTSSRLRKIAWRQSRSCKPSMGEDRSKKPQDQDVKTT